MSSPGATSPDSSTTSAAARFPSHQQELQDIALRPDGAQAGTMPSTAQGLMEKQSGHIVGPNLARDAQMLEHYMSPRDGEAIKHVRPNPYSVYSSDPRDPVVYVKVPRQRSTTTSGNDMTGLTGFKQCQIIDNILGPLKSSVIEL